MYNQLGLSTLNQLAMNPNFNATNFLFGHPDSQTVMQKRHQFNGIKKFKNKNCGHHNKPHYAKVNSKLSLLTRIGNVQQLLSEQVKVKKTNELST